MKTFDFDRFGDLRKKSVLDLGAGAGRHSIEAIIRGASVVSVEIDPTPLQTIPATLDETLAYLDIKDDTSPKMLSLAVSDARGLPFHDNSFDIVIVSEILEHIQEDHVVLREINRVTKAGGMIAISVPRAMPELLNWIFSKEYHSVKGGHIRIYRKRQLLQRIAQANLDVVVVSYAHGLHSPYWWLKTLLGLEKTNLSPIRRYQDLLIKQMSGRLERLDTFEKRVLDPSIGKSLVLYAIKT
ncbi:class I SAM-dependent methyltransferase [Acidithrix ferrooxidans]|uniref:Demethylmenaquinone methyltransferase n=1 Tax=Acidithrix ferrooxidans TaxID=1280514 RepID=A0A0D8HGR5_9ACTN|nr:class I SAM-dependent methyltransferase [Acidithrix ferrooxidans]KJF17039.1 demethylmenaquinone methyltransferase [Acidithrix ferrooxidans]